MKSDYLIDAFDKLGTRRVCWAFRRAYSSMDKPDNIPDSFWEKIKIWNPIDKPRMVSNHSETQDTDLIKSDYEIDSETATKRIDDAKKGDKKKYLDDAMKLAKKHIEKSNDAKSDVVSLNEKMKSVATNSDLKYNEEKKKLAEKYKNKNIVNASYTNGDNKMEISQKDLKKIMRAMNTINKHFAEEVEDEIVDENAENETEDMTTIELPTEIADAVRMALESDEDDEDEIDEDEDDEVEEDEEIEEEDKSDMTTIELPTEIADAVKEALECSDDSCEDDEESDDIEDEEDEESDYIEDEDDEKMEENFSMKSVYRFAETITETIENLNKKVNKLSQEMQDAANEKTIQFSKNEFFRFAETVTETIESIAEKVEQLEANVDNEVTKDVSNLADSFDDADDFITKSDEEVEEEVVVDNTDMNNDSPIYAGTENVDSIDMPVDEQFSKRYNKIKNFLTL